MAEIEIAHGNTWTTDWPTEPGWYWFYGWAFGLVADHRPKLHAVNVASGNSDDVMRIIDGNFMWEAEGHQGLFMPMENITLPAWKDVKEMAVKDA